MNISLISDFSFWWIAVILGAAGLLSWGFYFFRSKFKELSKSKLISLFILRFTSLFFIGFLLLNPTVKSIQKKEIKPTIIIAQDNSSSIINSPDSVYIRNGYYANLQNLIQKLELKYFVKQLSFGSDVSEGLSFSFNEKLSSFSLLFQEINTKYINQNIGAVVIASDGIYNRGANPEKLSSTIKAPIYTIALGDTTIIRDIKIDKLEYNSEVFKGNKTPVFVYVSANEMKSKNTFLTVKKGDTIVASHPIQITDRDFFQKFAIQVEAKDVGLNRFDFSISEMEGEHITGNNSKAAFINVSETKKKILLIQNGWHPDAGAISSALKNNEAFELEIVNASDEISDISIFDLVILHQLPSINHAVGQVIKQIVSQNKPVLFIIGQQTSIQALNQCNLSINITNFKNIYDNTNIGINEQFSLFKLPIDELVVKQFSPLTVPFANFPPSNSSNVLFFQSVGSLLTSKPLIYFPEIGRQKVGIICGEGIWRWRLQEYNYTQSHQISNNIIKKSIQYLIANENKKRFVIQIPNIVDEGQPLNIVAKLYNPSFELITDPVIKFSLFDEKGNEYPYFFEKDQFDYKLKINSLSVGKYYYKATTTVGNELFVKKGSFFIHEMQIEDQNLTANHNLLYKISNNTGGKMFSPSNCANIGMEIDNNPNVSTIVFPMKGISILIDRKYLFFIVLLIVSIEWFLRKLWGFR